MKFGNVDLVPEGVKEMTEDAFVKEFTGKIDMEPKKAYKLLCDIADGKLNPDGSKKVEKPVMADASDKGTGKAKKN